MEEFETIVQQRRGLLRKIGHEAGESPGDIGKRIFERLEQKCANLNDPGWHFSLLLRDLMLAGSPHPRRIPRDRERLADFPRISTKAVARMRLG